MYTIYIYIYIYICKQQSKWLDMINTESKVHIRKQNVSIECIMNLSQ